MLARSSNHQATALTIEQMQYRVPSAFSAIANDKVSDKYTHIPTYAIVSGLEKEGFLCFSAKQSASRLPDKKHFTKHMLRFRHIDCKPSINGLFPELVLINSHDGLSSYRLMSGLYRIVCTNGLIAGDTYADMRIKHQGDIIGNVIEGTYSIIENSKKMLEASENMLNINLNPSERLLLAEAAHQIKFEGNEYQGNAIKPERLLNARRVSEIGITDLFTTFNIIQENIMKGGLKGIGIDENGRKKYVTTRQVKSIDQDTAINRALWTLTEKMAELKQ